MTEPLDIGQVARIGSAEDMARLLDRRDLPRRDPHWWSAVVVACNGGLAKGDNEDPEALDWGRCLIHALMLAVEHDSLRLDDVIGRRMVAHAALMAYFGVSSQDPDRDPESVLRWFQNALGGSPERLAEEVRSLREEGRRNPRGRSGQDMARRLSAIRTGLDALQDIAARVTPGPLPHDYLRWLEVRRAM